MKSHVSLLVVVHAVDCAVHCAVNTTAAYGSRANYAVPTATDNCGEPSLAQVRGPRPGAVLNDTTTFVFVARDAAGNVAECRWTVNITAASALGDTIQVLMPASDDDDDDDHPNAYALVVLFFTTMLILATTVYYATRPR